MTTGRSYMHYYIKKRDEVHTIEETAEAFENSFAFCFELDRSLMTTPPGKAKLYADIWTINPDAIIKEADVCIFMKNSESKCGQVLVVNKNGEKGTANAIAKLIEDCPFVHSVIICVDQKKDGNKRCVRHVCGDNRPRIVDKANLLIDGDKLLLTVRTWFKSASKES